MFQFYSTCFFFFYKFIYKGCFNSILFASKSKFIIFIENKLWTPHFTRSVPTWWRNSFFLFIWWNLIWYCFFWKIPKLNGNIKHTWRDSSRASFTRLPALLPFFPTSPITREISLHLRPTTVLLHVQPRVSILTATMARWWCPWPCVPCSLIPPKTSRHSKNKLPALPRVIKICSKNDQKDLDENEGLQICPSSVEIMMKWMNHIYVRGEWNEVICIEEKKRS